MAEATPMIRRSFFFFFLCLFSFSYMSDSRSLESVIARVGFDHAKDLWALAQSGLDYVRAALRDDAMTGIDAEDGWLYVSKTDNGDAFTNFLGLLGEFGGEVEGWPTERAVHGAAQRALFPRHPFSAGADHSSAQLCTRSCRRRRARRRAYFSSGRRRCRSTPPAYASASSRRARGCAPIASFCAAICGSAIWCRRSPARSCRSRPM